MNISTILQFGYIVIIALALLVMAIQILAFYIAGKATDSIDDEITSAFTLFGAMLFIGMASALVNAVISMFLSGSLIPGVIASLIYLGLVIYSIAKIYELSVGKAILHFIISLIITVVGVGALGYVGTLAIPDLNLSDVTEMRSFNPAEKALENSRMAEERLLNEIEETERAADAELPTEEDILGTAEETTDLPEEVLEEEPIEEPTEEPETPIEEIPEYPTPSGPGLPGSAE